jgi:antitoxin (DNA-binding transcriptional repressor) of toxin-antitoxin stability system
VDEGMTVPQQRQPEREIGIRELRNAGKVVAELAAAGAVGRVTSGGRLVGWLVPASADEQRVEELAARGRVKPGRRRGLVGRRPLRRRSDVPPLSEALDDLRNAEDR